MSADILFRNIIIDKDLVTGKLKHLYAPVMLIGENVQVADFRNTEKAQYEALAGETSYLAVTTPIITPDKRAHFRDDPVLAPEYDGEDPDLDDPLQSIEFDSLILSDRTELKSLVTNHMGLHPQCIVLILASVGVSIPLPPLTFDNLTKDDINLLKQKLKDARKQYLHAVFDLAKQSREALKAENFDEVVRWATHEAYFNIAPKAREYAKAAEAYELKQSNGPRQIAGAFPTISSLHTAGRKAMGPLIKSLVKFDWIGALGETSAALAEALPSWTPPKPDPLVNYAIQLKTDIELRPKNQTE
ncbi:hypothetical protein [Bradyrhizobium sp. WSM1417]|uniref:hypothetical protein n=1 Tax=Bradyrhizobium sp. WSM1417 TaxID=754500 RepID=UPI0004812921|nr:hypothetical protein [Bradyrhizobium sp. WSM1417]